MHCRKKEKTFRRVDGSWSGWSTAQWVNIQMSVVCICCNQACCREWGHEAAQIGLMEPHASEWRNERHPLLCSELPYCLSWQHPSIPDAAGSWRSSISHSVDSINTFVLDIISYMPWALVCCLFVWKKMYQHPVLLGALVVSPLDFDKLMHEWLMNPLGTQVLQSEWPRLPPWQTDSVITEGVDGDDVTARWPRIWTSAIGGSSPDCPGMYVLVTVELLSGMQAGESNVLWRPSEEYTWLHPAS